MSENWRDKPTTFQLTKENTYSVYSREIQNDFHSKDGLLSERKKVKIFVIWIPQLAQT